MNSSYWETNMNNNHNFFHKLIMVHGSWFMVKG